MPLWSAVGSALVATSERPWLALAGVAAWPVIEYAAHRWLMHGAARFAPRLYKKIHGCHHLWPNDLAHFTIPIPVVALAVAALLAALPRAFVGGALLAYVAYDLAHLAAHGLAPFPFRARLAKHHAAHHRRSDEAYCVTQPWIDRLLGTAPKPRYRGTVAEHIAIQSAWAIAIDQSDASTDADDVHQKLR